LRDLATLLQVLSDSQGNILEDATAVAILSEAKSVAIEVEEKQEVAEETRCEIEAARKLYSRIGSCNAVLFFAVRDMATIDPMYQYSLTWFIKHFVRSIQVSSTPQTCNMHHCTACRSSHLVATLVPYCRALPHFLPPLWGY
jgi:hypothetical protein